MTGITWHIWEALEKMENLTEIRQCLRRRHHEFSVRSPLVIEGVRALPHTCFPKVCILYGALGLGVNGCICALSAPQVLVHYLTVGGSGQWDSSSEQWEPFCALGRDLGSRISKLASRAVVWLPRAQVFGVHGAQGPGARVRAAGHCKPSRPVSSAIFSILLWLHARGPHSTCGGVFLGG